jgi:hypothetical protein
MYIHIFAFRWKPGTTQEQKTRVAKEILVLKERIPAILEAHVGKNLSPRGQGYEFGGMMKFASRADFEGYNEHPAHQALLGWLLPLIEAMELDFET